jgi:hypothetical protein
MAESIDLRRVHAECYRATARPVIVDVPALRYLAIDGRGAAGYDLAVSAVRGVAYTLRYALRHRADGIDAPMMPLEGVWHGDGPHRRWTLLIAQPPLVRRDDVEQAKRTTARRRPGAPVFRVELRDVRLRRCAQVLHTGPAALKHQALAALDDFMTEGGLRPRGPRHEIYLSDPARTAPEKLRTILRQPVASTRRRARP